MFVVRKLSKRLRESADPGKNPTFCGHHMSTVPHLAYAEDVERGCVEGPDEKVLWAERLDDDGLPRPSQVGHRVVAPHLFEIFVKNTNTFKNV